MAGKNHHHLWQMLQRGFAEREGKQFFTFAYAKSWDPQRKNTKEFGAEEFFYGPEGSAADTNITDFELRTERHIQALRRAADGDQPDADKIAPLIVHLQMRSLYLRSEMIRVSTEIFGVLQDHLSSPEKAKRLVDAHIGGHRDVLEKQLTTLNLAPEDERLLSFFLESGLPELRRQIRSDLIEQGAAAFANIAPAIAQSIKEAHIRALETEFFAVDRVDDYKTWSFVVRRFDDEKLILPDTALAFLGSKRCSPLMHGSSDFSELVLPVSDQVAVIGAVKRPADRPAKTLNRILARCSYQGFAARYESCQLRKLAPRIGTYTELFSKNEIRERLSVERILDGM